MRKVIFIDRDGVINSDIGHYYIFRIEDFKINEGVIDFLHHFRAKGYEFIIITNQGGIARGQYGHQEVKKVHEYMLQQFKNADIAILDIFYCPHHSKVEKCLCRKPEPLMIQKAVAIYDIDQSKSYFIGDKDSDVQTAINAGVQPIKINANESLLNYIDIIKH